MQKLRIAGFAVAAAGLGATTLGGIQIVERADMLGAFLTHLAVAAASAAYVRRLGNR